MSYVDHTLSFCYAVLKGMPDVVNLLHAIFVNQQERIFILCFLRTLHVRHKNDGLINNSSYNHNSNVKAATSTNMALTCFYKGDNNLSN